MEKYCLKGKAVEAICVDLIKVGLKEVEAFTNEKAEIIVCDETRSVFIRTTDSKQEVCDITVGDWIVKGESDTYVFSAESFKDLFVKWEN